jgi:hypothetical protein
MASRTAVLAIFGTVGFAIGFLAFLASPLIADALASILPELFVDKNIVFATITGAAGAAISTATVSMWARRP